jgi:hypothetical protein
MAKASRPDKLRRLQDLADQPAAQFDYALALAPTETRLDLLDAVIEVLGRAPHDPRVRPVLLEAYQDCLDRHDAGCARRVALLRALRPAARREDAALLARAAATYEFLPPGPSEVAAGLRSTALVILNEVDETLAGFHAARLLTDERTSKLSGEPAITAVQVLASQGQTLSLYGYATRTDAVALPEVMAECLRYLTAVPLSVLRPLVDRYVKSPDEIVLLGLFELLLAHAERAAFHTLIVEYMRETMLFDLYRWLLTAALTSHDEALIAAVTKLGTEEKHPRKREIIKEAMELVRGTR